MKLFLGVDGGQSSTVALIADETGRVLGSGKGGPCNHVAAAESRAKFARAMAECVGMASEQAGLPASQISFEAACLGFSGGVADKETYSRELIRSKHFKITHDAEIALTGATGGDPGIIVIAGTGSIALGKNESAKLVRSGGWGYIFGDEGGAFDIARQALRAALAMEEGWGEPTVLLSNLLKASNSNSANDLLHDWYNHFNRSEIARLAPLVDEAAKAGDSVAVEILEQAAAHLSALVANVYGQLFQHRDALTISFIGGVFESELLKLELKRSVLAQTGCEATPPQYPPAAGAAIEALRLVGNKSALSDIPAIKS